MCPWLSVARFLLQSSGQQVHFQCVWISQTFCSSFAPVTHVTSLTGYAANEFLMSWRERKERSDAFRSRSGSQKLGEPGMVTQEHQRWVAGLNLTRFGSCCVWGALAQTLFCPAAQSGHKCLQYRNAHFVVPQTEIRSDFFLEYFSRKKKIQHVI